MENLLILTEKPSVAKDIAAALDPGATSKEGYISALSGKVIITYAFGHLFKIAGDLMPPTPSVNDLPFFPDKFRYEPTSSGAKQGKNIKNLLKGIEKVVIATDAGREGELIARLILIETGWKNWDNTFRFWTSEALTAPVVKHGFNNLKPASQYDNYYFSAISRQHGDYTLGLNLSRIASIKGGGIWSIGRVQTPVLKILSDRFHERQDFTPLEYHVIEGTFIKSGSSYTGFLILPGDEVISKEKALDVYLKIKDSGSGTVKSVVSEFHKEQSPVLHSLTSLQREANKIHGYTAQQTLDIAQSLYENHKVLSYPRTDSNYLADNDQHLVSSMLQVLGYKDLKINIPGNKIFDSKKLTDHHALVPLDEFNKEGKELNVYNLVKNRFLAAFSNDFEYEKQKVITTVGDFDFESTGKRILKSGWMVFYEQKEKALPVLSEGEKIKVEKVENLQKWTKPPQDYNDSSILKKMEVLNLGTPATRASILEKLIKIDYIKREKKALIATGKGLELISKINSSDVVSPELTREWEEKLGKISSRRDYDLFLEQIKNFTANEVAKIKVVEIAKKSSAKQLELARKLSKEKGLSLPENLDEFHCCSEFITRAIKEPGVNVGTCSLCEGNSPLQDIGKGVKCLGCERVVWKEMFGKKMSEKDVLSLFSGKQVSLRNLKSKSGKRFSAIFALKEKVELVQYINDNKK